MQPAALETAGFADREEPLDGAVPVVGLGAVAGLAPQHAVTQRALGGVVGSRTGRAGWPNWASARRTTVRPRASNPCRTRLGQPWSPRPAYERPPWQARSAPTGRRWPRGCCLTLSARKGPQRPREPHGTITPGNAPGAGQKQPRERPNSAARADALSSASRRARSLLQSRTRGRVDRRAGGPPHFCSGSTATWSSSAVPVTASATKRKAGSLTLEGRRRLV